MCWREVPIVNSAVKIVLVSISAVVAVAALAAPVAVSIEVRARDVAPGEPLRVVIRAPVLLESLEGEFLGRAVFMSRTSATQGAAGADHWVGWTMIALDEKPATHAFEVSGTTRDGGEVVDPNGP